ncbi:MAG: efflux RND transporter permease subunit [Alphaproteobacteria bacterium]|nr:efflux RND transporter permease subunit [Alphaproteobacteria bacterium]
MPSFFIDRPIFAWVVAILITMVGTIAMLNMGIESYPNIAPPQVVVNATFPGANADTVEKNVTQVIEQQLTGIDNLLYFSSSSDSTGNVSISVTFAPGTNPDIAQVQVQNQVQQALPLLPQEVTQLGVVVRKAQTNFLMVVALYDTTGRYTNVDISDYLRSTLQDPLARVPGVGQVRVFGAEYAMRIWLDPFKLRTYGLMPSDVRSAIQAQNTQVAAGEIGAQPVVKGQELDATVTALSRLQTPEQFRGIILRTDPSGATVRLSDVARVELGAEDYGTLSRFGGKTASGLAIQLAPGANALTTANAVKARVEQLRSALPPGIEVSFPVDTTSFIRISIQQVIVTLIEAIVLVVIVMFIFLQNWRATLIPAITIPVVLLGTFGVLAAAGYSINVLTLFALVLAIGLLVDDAIVVIENVERIMSEEGLSPREATRKSMEEITGALIAIALVLSAVFLPMAFFGGSTGVIYRQFSITIVAAMVLSVTLALILTPTLCATLLTPVAKGDTHAHGRFANWFNRNFSRGVERYRGILRRVIARPAVPLVVYSAAVVLLVVLFFVLPTSFLPEEDQGFMLVQFTLPVGAQQSRTLAVAKQVEHHFLVDEKADVDNMFAVTGFSFAGSGQNVGLGFIHLKDWSQRKGAQNRAAAVVQRAMMALSKVRDAQIFALVPPSVPGLGQSGGFDLELEDRGNLGHQGLVAAQNQLLAMAARNPKLSAVRPNGLADTPQLHVDVDQNKATALGLNLGDVNDTLSSAWAGVFVNDFIDRNRVKRVYMEGDTPYRMVPSDLDKWSVRNATNNMVPFSSFATTSWQTGPSTLQRYNGFPALEIQGGAAPGQSSGTAMAEMQNLIAKLPRGAGFEWTGLSYQQLLSGAQAPLLYGLSLLVIFLCLAALYESWSVPFAVMLVIPLGVVGVLAAALLRGLTNDVFFQVGLLATMGLAAKNAILIVEFAEFAVRRGESAFDAAMEAARLRLRPILMTSIAFIAGVAPLAVANGAGAASQNDIGTGVMGGMFTATALAIFFVPLFFVLVARGKERLTARKRLPSAP